MKEDSTVERPILLGTDGLHHATISGLTMRNSPNWFNLISNSSNILITDITLLVDPQPKETPAKVRLALHPENDALAYDLEHRRLGYISQLQYCHSEFCDYQHGWYASQQSSRSALISSDCVSFKPNSTSVIVQNLECSNSHGISVGSLGQYQGEVDLVEDLYIYNVTMTNAGNFARIKVWPGVPPDTTDSTSGGGLGMVRNVTYDHLYSNGNDGMANPYSVMCS
jgi:galacturan 1,4-alpha-galacturonidase